MTRRDHPLTGVATGRTFARAMTPKRSLFLVLVIATLLAAAVDAAPARAELSRPVANARQSGPGSVLAKLVQLTRRAVVGGRKVLTSKTAKRARQIGNRVRKATNLYCGEWVGHFQRFPYPRLSTARAVGVWRFAWFTHPELPAGRAYGYCRTLGYWAILAYG
jgi:hypothetical protein